MRIIVFFYGIIFVIYNENKQKILKYFQNPRKKYFIKPNILETMSQWGFIIALSIDC